jgi:hypothetical protein
MPFKIVYCNNLENRHKYNDFENFQGTYLPLIMGFIIIVSTIYKLIGEIG